ncbi:MAG: hypothetical protein OEX02_00955 [Cyclobacteriaceae bacterium]|nr:hypothetical protein [Cyclobacteriaceae bacterium]
MILPYRKETIVLTKKAEEVLNLLNQSVDHKRKKDKKVFTGKVQGNTLNLTRITERVENFKPQIKGRIENTSRGSILFLTYTLEFSTRMYVVFWSVTSFFFALVLWFIRNDLFLGLMALGGLILNILVTHVNFYRQLKITRSDLYKVLNDQD